MDLQIDVSKCVRCGACIADCPVRILKKDPEGRPFVNAGRADDCMDCQHCLAVCPTAALSVNGHKPENTLPNKVRPSFEEMRSLIQNRRTCRRYKQQNVAREKIDALLEAAAFAPTGVNARGLHLAVIDDIEVMNRFRQKVIGELRKAVSKGLPKALQRFAEIPEQFDKGNDVLFRTAPHMIAVSCAKEAHCSNIDPVIALSYIELTAQTLGLGTTWCGLVYWVLAGIIPGMTRIPVRSATTNRWFLSSLGFQLDKLNFLKRFFLTRMVSRTVPELQKHLKIPDGYELRYVMLFGEPDVRYFRSAQRDELPLTRVEI